MSRAGILLVLVILAWVEGSSAQSTKEPSYLSWSENTVESIGKKMRVNGQVGSSFDFRIIHTEKSFNYKLRATWLTPEVIRASARHWQLRERLTDEQTQSLVAQAENAGDTAFMVELDPREGSGVIPSDWIAVLRSKGSTTEVKGKVSPALRSVKALSGIFQRDYAYEMFWVVFPLLDDAGKPVLSNSASDAELLVSLYNKQGKVS